MQFFIVFAFQNIVDHPPAVGAANTTTSQFNIFNCVVAGYNTLWVKYQVICRFVVLIQPVWT
jgi:hypothetical protein